MPINQEQRATLEDAILRWANKEIAPLEITAIARAVHKYQVKEVEDKGCNRAAHILDQRTYPDDRGLLYNRGNWKRATKCLAYLRSNVEANEYRYEERTVPWRRDFFYGYVILVGIVLIYSIFSYGKIGLLVWPAAAGLGWVQWFGNSWIQSRRGHSAAYPFDTMKDRDAFMALADSHPAMPPYMRPRLRTYVLTVVAFPLFLVVSAVGLSVIIVIACVYSGIKGPLFLRPWTIRRCRIRMRPGNAV